jgi:hypothetical protein
MAPFAAGIAILALLLATYMTWRNWIAWGSIAMSMVALAGLALLATAKDRAAPDAYVLFVGQLAPMLDQRAVNGLTAAITQVAASEATRLPTAPERPPRTSPAAVAATWSEPKRKQKPVSGDAVAWLLDESVQVPARTGDRFRIGGLNVSDQALMGVRGTLKPDLSGRKMKLSLEIEGRRPQDGTVILPDAQFSLSIPKAGGAGQDSASVSGGAIMTFRYSQAGQQRTMILYLTPPMLARLSNQER